ncbi:hypothetical protein Nepgr_029818 [Nepenthes gracilis]|uniref:Uncharacterized protein n=1 Tax=Nepenthes gracilis TaxID=150966 RepID=A0AAD3Y584_NEPGR|nr:hypothetical protein Nepgr_029818 [Nepenthes gracilis]
MTPPRRPPRNPPKCRKLMRRNRDRNRNSRVSSAISQSIHRRDLTATRVFSLEESDATTSDFPAVAGGSQAQWPSSPPPVAAEPFCEPNLTVQFDDSMEIWYRILTRGGELEDLLA